jgi:hypothetical protein
MEYGTIIASGVMGMVGTAVGALLNHFLSRSSRLEERVDDAKKAEYRELLGTLNRSFMVLMELYRPIVVQGPEEQREALRAETDSVRTIADRLYIAEDLARMNVMRRWTDALNGFKKERDILKFSTELGTLSDEIKKSALRKT